MKSNIQTFEDLEKHLCDKLLFCSKEVVNRDFKTILQAYSTFKAYKVEINRLNDTTHYLQMVCEDGKLVMIYEYDLSDKAFIDFCLKLFIPVLEMYEVYKNNNLTK